MERKPLNMKKISAALLAILMLFLQVSGVLAETANETNAPTASKNLTVGNTTPMRGEFFTDMWGNATSDIDVRDLLHGYNLIRWDASVSMFKEDASVVRALKVTDNAVEDRSFRMTLWDDLYYSDGSKITAWDYAFSFLFQIAPEIGEIGGKPLRTEHLLGYADYVNGNVPYLAGVQVVDDQTLVVTISHEYLPFFYEKGLLYCNPYPIRVIAPGVVVRDDGQGVYLANEDETVTEPVFTAELLRSTVLDEETGYLSHPSVVSGPYTLTSWDGVTAEFALNPYYKGNYKGQKPRIDTLTYTLAENDTMMDKLISGEFGLLNKVMRSDVVKAGTAAAARADVSMTKYPRTGMGYISFLCERDTVSSQAVRQAIAWCMDRDQITKAYTGDSGKRVDGYYGLGQWMYGVVSGSMTPPVDPPKDKNNAAEVAKYNSAVAAFKSLSLNGLTKYTVNAAKAAALLDGDGWQLNEDGIREKEINGEKVTLELRLLYPEGNSINELFEQYFVPNLEKVGIRLTMEAMPMGELLTQYYKQDERDADMIFLASNFDIVFDPAVHFIVDQDGNPNWAYTNQADEELYQIALNMRKTKTGDALTYLKRWVAFQERFNEVLPMLPIYGNAYYDFYTSALTRYEIGQNVTWGQAIVGAYLNNAANK